MKTKSFLCLILCTALVLALLPVSALADDAPPISSGASVAWVGEWTAISKGGDFTWPRSIAIDGLDNVYVLDSNLHVVSKLAAGGSSWSYIALDQGFTGGSDAPWAIAAHNLDPYNRLYLLNSIQNTSRVVWRYDPATQVWNDITYGQSFRQPEAIAVHMDGTVYVTDSYDNGNYIEGHVLKLPAGSTTWAEIGNWSNGQFEYVPGITVDGNGGVYITDYSVSGSGRVSRLLNAQSSWEIYSDKPSGGSRLKMPMGIARDNLSNLYVADIERDALHAVPNDNSLVWWYLSNGSPNIFSNPTDVAVDSQGYVYVTDTGTHTVYKHAPWAKQLKWQTQPGGAMAGAALSPQPVIVLSGGPSNSVPLNAGSGNLVNVSLNNASGASLGGQTYAAFGGGTTATFGSLSVDRSGTYSLTATATIDNTNAVNGNSFPNAADTSTLTTKSGSFTITSQPQAAAPTSSLPGATVVANQTTITLSTTTIGATIYYTTDGSDPTTDSASGNSVVITGSPGAVVTVKAIAGGSGFANSTVATFTYTLQGPPPAPTIYAAVGGNGFVLLNWYAPADDGGAAITSYQVKVGALDWADIGNVLSHTADYLTNGTEYTLQVRAVNSFGPGTAAVVSATPRSKTVAPSAPQNFTATPSDRQAELNWSAPLDDGGATISGYQVSKDNGANWTDLGNTLTYTYTGLDNGTEYTFQVRAVSAGVGPGAAATKTAIPQAPVIDKTLLNITAPPAVTGVANGAAKTAAALGLPATVTLVTDDGNVSASVAWDVAASSYDPASAAEQTFTVNGTVTLPDGVINPDGVSLSVSISVTVNAAASADKTLVSVTAPAAITGVANGAAKTAAALGLPATVTLVTDDGNVSASVAWDVAASSYDPAATTEQTFTVNGTVMLPDGVINPDGVSLSVSISVTVNALPSPNTHIIMATAGSGGSISPSGAVSVTEGGGLTFTITPNSNYSIYSVTVDGVNQGAITSYTFANVTGPHTISATFTDAGGSPEPAYIFRTLTDSTTGVTVSGIIHRDAVLTVKNTVLHAAGTCAACDVIRQRMKDVVYLTLFNKDISLSLGFSGPLTITIPVGDAYNGQTVTVLHCANGTLKTYSATVRDGKAAFSVTDLSPFAVFTASRASANLPNTGDGGSFPLWLGLIASGVLFNYLSLSLRRRLKRTECN